MYGLFLTFDPKAFLSSLYVREKAKKKQKKNKKENSFITVIPFTPMNDEVGISSYNIRSFIKRMGDEKKERDQ